MKKRINKLILLTIICVALGNAGLGNVGLAAPETTSGLTYQPFYGEIVGVTQGDTIMLMVKASDESRAQFIISASTYIDSEVKLENGRKIICYYEKRSLVESESVPQYSAEAIVAQSNAVNVAFGYFDDNLVNENKTLKLINTSKAKNVLANGEKYSGSLKNQKLLVFYKKATKSSPAKISPSKIIAFPSPQLPKDAYGSFTGKVVSATKTGDDTYVMLENDSGDQTQFVIGKSTFVLEDAKLEEGQRLTGFYDLGGIAPAIFPPRYNAFAIVQANDEHSVFVGKFNKSLISADGSLKLINTGKAKRINHLGKTYKGSMKNKTLVVFYKAATRSIPAQTSPDRIIVLPAKK